MGKHIQKKHYANDETAKMSTSRQWCQIHAV